MARSRRTRKEKSLTRKKAKREPSRRILIVCEGSKTEPIYFELLKKHMGNPAISVEVIHDGDCSPLKIVEVAEKHARSAVQDRYDAVFCVFDKDDHASYVAAVRKLGSKNCKKLKLEAAHSAPCFEYYLIMHYEKSNRAYTSNSQVHEHLKRIVPDYDKVTQDTILGIAKNVEQAIINSEYIVKQNKESGTEEPVTYAFRAAKSILNK